MVKRRNPAARRGDLAEIEFGSDDAGIDAALGEDLAPGADDQAVAIGPPAIGVLAALSRAP